MLKQVKSALVLLFQHCMVCFCLSGGNGQQQGDRSWRVTLVFLHSPFLTFSQGVLQENWQTKKAKAETLLLQLPAGDLSASFTSIMCSAMLDMAESLAKMGIEIHQDLLFIDANEILNSGN